MDIIGFVFFVLHALARLYTYVILAHVILSLLLAFNVVNARHQFVTIIWGFTSRLVEPALAFIRRIFPFLRNLGNIDITPVILLILVYGIDAYFLFPMAVRPGSMM
jgi:YggT family protein